MIRVVLTDVSMSIMHSGVEKLVITEDSNRNLVVMIPEGESVSVQDGVSFDTYEAPDIEVRDMRRTSREDRRTPRPKRRVASRRRRVMGAADGTTGTTTNEGQNHVARPQDVESILSLIETEPDDISKAERRKNTYLIAEQVYGGTEQKHIMSVAGVRAAKSRGVYD